MNRKDFRVLSVEETTMEITNQRVAVIELSDLDKNVKLPGFQVHSFVGGNNLRCVIDFTSNLTTSLISSANNEDIVSLDLDDFRKRVEIKEGMQEVIYYHNNIKLINFFAEQKNYKNQPIVYILHCSKCRTDIRFDLSLGIPENEHIDIENFKNILKQTEIECYICGLTGFAGDELKFELVSTKGLDVDLSQSVSSVDKLKWYYDIDPILQNCIADTFSLHGCTQLGFITDMYLCSFLLIKVSEFDHKENHFGFYKMKSIELNDGKTKISKKEYPFLIKDELGTHLVDQLKINPAEFTIEEIDFMSSDGQKFYMPLLIRSLVSF